MIVVPAGLSLADGVSGMLRAWVRNGGYLVLAGPAGVYDSLGHEDNSLLNGLLGIKGFEQASEAPEVTFHSKRFKLPGSVKPWRVKDGQHTGQTLAGDASGNPMAILGEFGKGKVLLFSFDVSKVEQFRPGFYSFIAERIRNPRVYSPQEEVELVLREDAEGRRHLTGINLDATQSVVCPVIVQGACERVVDLTVGRGLPVEVEVLTGMTSFVLDLHPGEGRQLFLGKPKESRPPTPRGLADSLGRLLRLKALLTQAEQLATSSPRIARWVEARLEAVRRGKTDLPATQIAVYTSQIEESLHGQKNRPILDRIAKARVKIAEVSAVDPVTAARLAVLLGNANVAIEKGRGDLAAEYLGVTEQYLVSNKSVVRSGAIDFEVARAAAPVKVDGDLSEWSGRWKGEIALKTEGNTADEAVSLDVMWDATSLYLAFKVKDNEVGNTEERSLWMGDCVEVFLNVMDDFGLPKKGGAGVGLATPKYGPDDYQFLFGVNGKQISGSANPLHNPDGSQFTDLPFAVTRTDDGYQMEMAIPWSELQLKPVVGYTLGFSVAVDDCERGLRGQYEWKGTDHNYKDTTDWGRVRLSP